MKTILITGAMGQIGRVLVKRLRGRYKVICVDIVDPDEELAGIVSGQDVSFYRLDLLKDDLSIIADAHQIDALIHLASVVDGSRDVLGKARETIELNLFATINILKACPGLKHIIFSSSMMVYGLPQFSPINENHPTLPVDLYGISKLLVEEALRIHAETSGIMLSILRFTSIYGPGKYSGKSARRAIPNFIRLARNNEAPVIFSHAVHEKRDYLYIDDAVEAIVLSLARPFNDVINIGSARSTTILELAEIIVEQCGASRKVVVEQSSVPSSGPSDYLLDIAKSKALIDFFPHVSLEQGLRAEIDHV